ncbi:MAG: hypothetical protein KGL39_20340 [Patescibacteria group bacterium]|nr:hypothetical protein [Patescibacteria group bacterium]
MPTAPYDYLETVVQTARVRLLDAVQSLAGEIITDAAPFTPTMVNAAWRRMQEYLAMRGFAAFNRDLILSGVPAWASGDPGVFVWFNWTEYFDGVNAHAAPVFPQDMIMPFDLYERQSGSNGIFVPMDQVFNGLPTANPGSSAGARDILNRLWEWRGEAIYMPGATTTTDIRLRYAAYLADFTSAVANWPTTQVPIMRCLNSFAWFICAEAARARGDLDAGGFDQLGMDSAEYIWNRDYQQGRSLYKRAELGKVPDVDSRTSGPNNPSGPQRGGGQ